jgi:hypothetical protein
VPFLRMCNGKAQCEGDGCGYGNNYPQQSEMH